MNKIYEKDIITDSKQEHFIHIAPNIHDLKKIINIEGPQRILILLYKDNLFTCAKAYENTHQDIYNTLHFNNYIKTDYNNFSFLIETKQYFGGSILFNKKSEAPKNEGMLLYCQNFNILIVNGNYNSVSQAIDFYEILPNTLKEILGPLNVEECQDNLEKDIKHNCLDSSFDSYVKSEQEKDKFLRQLFKYINDIDQLLQEDNVNIKQIKFNIKLAINLYHQYKKNY